MTATAITDSDVDQVQLFLMVLRGQISEEVKAGQQVRMLIPEHHPVIAQLSLVMFFQMI